MGCVHFVVTRMGKKILYIVLGALVVFGLLFLAYTFFFTGTPAKDNNGLGTSGDTTGLPSASGGDTNGQVPVGSNDGTNGSISLSGNGSQTGGTGGLNGSNSGGGSSDGTSGFSSTSPIFTNADGVTWIGSPFNPSDINSISTGAGGATPTITSQVGPSGNGTSLATLLAGTIIAGSVSCAIQAGIVTLTSGAATAGAGASAAVDGGVFGFAPIPGTSPGVNPNIVADYSVRTNTAASYNLQVSQAARNAGKDQVTFLGCIVNTLAKAALAQITASVVNWINSGFNGSPSFVTNYQQFFQNTADVAAGQFIQGAGLSFLCSPFQLQIKIAVAQSYANRNAQSCTLTKVIGNVNSFMKGNFNQGGWGGFVSFTTVPTNNPYGAFAYAQVGLANAQQNALANAKSNITPTGFLNVQQAYDCQATVPQNGTVGSNNQAVIGGAIAGQSFGASCPANCKCKVTTPGTVIENSLSSTLDTPLKQLGLANSLDQIINALTTQLMVKVLQNGLTSVSQTTTQTPADIAAQSQALSLLQDMQSRTTFAQQIGAIDQGSIADIQNTQANLNGLANCWAGNASSTNNTAAAQNAASANSSIQSLEAQIVGFNNSITQMNNQIATLNQFVSDISSATTASGVASVTARYNTAVSAGSFSSQADVTTAQQNRTTLQSQLAAINQSTESGLAQCNAASGQ